MAIICQDLDLSKIQEMPSGMFSNENENENENENMNSNYTDNTPNRSPFELKDFDKIRQLTQTRPQLNKHKVMQTPKCSNEDYDNEDLNNQSFSDRLFSKASKSNRRHNESN